MLEMKWRQQPQSCIADCLTSGGIAERVVLLDSLWVGLGSAQAVLQGREPLAGPHLVQKAQSAGEHASVLLLSPGLRISLQMHGLAYEKCRARRWAAGTI